MAIGVVLHALADASPAQAEIVARACGLLETALNHPEFRGRVATARYRRTRFEDARGESRSVPPHEVIDYIVSGAERGTAGDGVIDLRIRLDSLPRGVVGSTRLGELPFRTAYWFIDGCVATGDAVSPARHFIHEWLHVAGFYHSPNNKARGDVPYVVGDIVRDLLTRDKQAAESAEMARMLDGSSCGASEGPREPGLRGWWARLTG